MCAEFQIRARSEELKRLYRVASPGTFEPQPAYYPKQRIPVIGLMADGVSRGLNLLRWGLIPSDSANAEPDRQPFNARSETVTRIPIFSRPFFHGQRGLIPLDAFFEWTATAPKKRFRCEFKGGGPLAAAALWDVWTDGTTRVGTATMITTEPNELIRDHGHHRMPVILRPDDFDVWLNPNTPIDRVKALLQTYPADETAIEQAPRDSLPKKKPAA